MSSMWSAGIQPWLNVEQKNLLLKELSSKLSVFGADEIAGSVFPCLFIIQQMKCSEDLTVNVVNDGFVPSRARGLWERPRGVAVLIDIPGSDLEEWSGSGRARRIIHLKVTEGLSTYSMTD